MLSQMLGFFTQMETESVLLLIKSLYYLIFHEKIWQIKISKTQIIILTQKYLNYTSSKSSIFFFYLTFRSVSAWLLLTWPYKTMNMPILVIFILFHPSSTMLFPYWLTYSLLCREVLSLSNGNRECAFVD